MPSKPVLRSESANCNFNSDTGTFERPQEEAPSPIIRPATPEDSPTMTTTFYINPYDQELDLSKKEHQKLYLDGCEGIEKEERFDGSHEKYSSFLKLIGTKMEDIRVKTCLKVATEWETTGDDIENPVAGDILDM